MFIAIGSLQRGVATGCGARQYHLRHRAIEPFPGAIEDVIAFEPFEHAGDDLSGNAEAAPGEVS